MINHVCSSGYSLVNRQKMLQRLAKHIVLIIKKIQLHSLSEQSLDAGKGRGSANIPDEVLCISFPAWKVPFWY
jgi:hypothetical protein